MAGHLLWYVCYGVSNAGYKTNTPFLNHCITAFFRRICNPEGLDLEPMLYQVWRLPCL